MSSATATALARAIDERAQILTDFLAREQEALARACYEMARAFTRGGLLIPLGAGPAATDAAHLAVEFMHPVIVGKRALPALAPSNDPSGASSAGTLVRPDDIAVLLEHGEPSRLTRDALAEARRVGALCLAFTGSGQRVDADYCYEVPSDDPHVIQEVQETAYHELWELVHVFFEHPGLLAEACITCGDVAVEARVAAVKPGTATVEQGGAREDVATDLVGEVAIGDLLLCHAGVALEKVDEAGPDPTAFLYPFLGAEERDLDAVLVDVRASVVRKGGDVVALRRDIDLGEVERCAAAVHARLERGGRLLAFGNGGSSTDAQDVAADALACGWPAASLTNDVATVTAVGNDVGFDNVFARQLIALGREQDVALAITTSGSSPNVVAGLEEAHRRGMLTCAITGYDGGRLAELDWLDHLFVARSDYIPRLQEAHATVYHLLLEAIGAPA